MSAPTEDETWLRAHLAVITEPVTPEPDPYGRLLRRHRASRVRRGAGAGATLLAAGVTAAITATVALTGPAGPPTTQDPLESWFRWVEELVASPPRGSLAADDAFRQELEQAVTQVVRSGERHEDLLGIDESQHADQSVRVMFADDIDDRRVAVLALQLATPPDHPPYPAGSGRTRALWLVGPRGASASSLASAVTNDPAAGVDSGSAIGRPFTVLRVGERSDLDPDSDGYRARLAEANAAIIYVGLAPPGCTVSAAPASTPDSWTPEPTGSYIIRTPADYRAEYWRVTCDGVVRQEGTVPTPTNGISPELIEPPLADLAAAEKDDDMLRSAVSLAAYELASVEPFVTGPAHLRYAGLASGLRIGEEHEHEETPRAAVVAAPRMGSTWFCVFAAVVGLPNRHEGAFTTVVLDTDPFAADATVAVAMNPRVAGPQVLAVLTSAAATAQLVASDGTVLESSTVADQFVVFAVPDAYLVDQFWAPDGLRVVAYDEDGSVVSTTPVIARRATLSVDGVGDWR